MDSNGFPGIAQAFEPPVIHITLAVGGGQINVGKLGVERIPAIPGMGAWEIVHACLLQAARMAVEEITKTSGDTEPPRIHPYMQFPSGG